VPFGPGLLELFKQGVRGNSIGNIRAILLQNGFVQSLANNKKGYLFRNAIGEEVRIMHRNSGWDIRIRNQFGNYLDDCGQVASPGKTHGITVSSQ
jgi:hypothetical protein